MRTSIVIATLLSPFTAIGFIAALAVTANHDGRVDGHEAIVLIAGAAAFVAPWLLAGLLWVLAQPAEPKLQSWNGNPR